MRSTYLLMQSQACVTGKGQWLQEDSRRRALSSQPLKVQSLTYSKMPRTKNLKMFWRQQKKLNAKMLQLICEYYFILSVINQYLRMQNSQRQIYEQQIKLLRQQIKEQQKREQNIKGLIDTLTEQIQYMREIQQQNFRLTQLNERLLEGVKQAKTKHSEEIKYYETQISMLKQQIYDKMNQLERSRVDYQKRQLIHEEKISKLEAIIEKKSHKMSNLQKKIHDQSILKRRDNSQSQQLMHCRNSRLTQKSSDLGVSALRVLQTENCYGNQNSMRASNVSTLSRKTRTSEYLLMDKQQMKTAMGMILKKKRQIEKGNIHYADTIEYHPNRTMF